MYVNVFLFFLGFTFLLLGARWLISGATSLAKYFNISQWAIGVVIVGIGTSVPELAINIASVFNGTGVGVGTILGSNTFNLLVILGLSAIISPLVIYREWIQRDFLINIGAVLIVVILLFFPVLGDVSIHGITRPEGVILFSLFLLWFIYTIMRQPEHEIKTDYKVFTFLTSFILIIAGIVGVFFGGRWIVGGAEVFARSLGVSEYIIGLTIVGMGTSVPELSVSLVAAFRRNASMAVGNVIGSNIFDFLGILGVVALFKNIITPERIGLDILVTLSATVLLFLVVFFGKRNILTRWEGFCFVALYAGYIIFLVL